ncbi:MAG: DUF3892 domain-containing protein [Microbacteriaceae bacterium]|nr:DUF3892 domain-containing protein [Microbacteriaceae bacterium]
MTAQLTHVRFHGYHRNEDVAIYRWQLDSGERGESDRASLIAWMEQGNEIVVPVDGAWHQVGVVRMAGAEPYLCTHHDGQWTDGLLRLPMF